MTCESALELLLDADPSEFRASERTPLGDHLRGCARCRRVAAQLMVDTQRLAVALEAAVPARRPGRRVMQVTLVPAFAMAAIVLALVLRGGPQVADIASPVNTPAASVVIPPGTAGTAVSVLADPRPRTARVVRHEVRAFARAVPLAPVRLASSSSAVAQLPVESSGLTVTPPAGTRATVMQTSNPKLVVVWLH